MDKIADKPAADTLPSNDAETYPAGPIWQPAPPGEQPPQELAEAKLAHERRQMERILDHLQIHDPRVRWLLSELMLAKRSYDASRLENNCLPMELPPNAIECALWQGRAMMVAVNGNTFMRRHDVIKPFRDMLSADADFAAGSLAPLIALRGNPPNKTNTKRPSTALQRAMIKLFVHVLTIGGTQNGGLNESEAERRVAKLASDHGLKRTQLGVHGVCVAIGNGADQEAADQFEALKAVSRPTDVRHWRQKDREAWVKQRATIFRKLTN